MNMSFKYLISFGILETIFFKDFKYFYGSKKSVGPMH